MEVGQQKTAHTGHHVQNLLRSLKSKMASKILLCVSPVDIF